MPNELTKIKEDLKKVPTFVWWVGAGAVGVLYVVRAKMASSGTTTAATDTTASTPAGTVASGDSGLSASDLSSLLSYLQQNTTPTTSTPVTSTPSTNAGTAPDVGQAPPAGAWAGWTPETAMNPPANWTPTQSSPTQGTAPDVGQSAPAGAWPGWTPATAMNPPVGWKPSGGGIGLPYDGTAQADIYSGHYVTLPTSKANPYR